MVTLTQDDLELVAVQYQRAAAVAGAALAAADSAAFDAHVSGVLHTLSQQLSSTGGNEVLRRLDTVAAKHALSDLVLQRVHTSLTSMASSQDRSALQGAVRGAGELLSQLHAQRQSLHASLLAHARSHASSSDAALKQLHSSMKAVEGENAQLIGAAEHLERELARVTAAKEEEAAKASKKAAELEATVASLRADIAAARAAEPPSSQPAATTSAAAVNYSLPVTKTVATATAERVSPVAAVLARGVSFISVNTDDGESVTSQPSNNARGDAPAASRPHQQRRKPSGSSSSYMKPTQSWRAHHVVGGAVPAQRSTLPTSASAKHVTSPGDASARDRVLQLLLPGASSASLPMGVPMGSSSPRSSVTGGGGDGGDFKMLSLKALKDAMDAIYSSKARYDAKCASAHMPRETMEAHLYTWLNTRFGIRALVLEQARSIIASVDYYAPYDNDVAVFGAILRNEVDEEFRLVQAQLKETARELLRLQLKAAHGMAGDVELAAMLAARMGGSPVLAPRAGEGQIAGVVEQEWREIVQHMYSPADAALLLPLLRNTVVRLAVATARGLCTRISTLVPPGAASTTVTPPASPRSSRAVDTGILIVHEEAVREALSELSPDAVAALMSRSNPDGLLPWDVLLKVLLDFQFAGHVRFLAPLRNLFSIADPAGAGSLSVDGFKRVLQGLSPLRTPAEVAVLVRAADPNDTGMVTFSDSVAAAARELASRVRHTSASVTASSMATAHAAASTQPRGAFLSGGAAAFGSDVSALRHQPSHAVGLARPASAVAQSFRR